MRSKKCPNCKSRARVRIKRTGFLQRIPLTKAYRCQACFSKFMWFPYIDYTIVISSSISKNNI